MRQLTPAPGKIVGAPAQRHGFSAGAMASLPDAVGLGHDMPDHQIGERLWAAAMRLPLDLLRR